MKQQDPVQIDFTNPATYWVGSGNKLIQIRGNRYQLVDHTGKHLFFLIAEEIDSDWSLQ